MDFKLKKKYSAFFSKMILLIQCPPKSNGYGDEVSKGGPGWLLSLRANIRGNLMIEYFYLN